MTLDISPEEASALALQEAASEVAAIMIQRVDAVMAPLGVNAKISDAAMPIVELLTATSWLAFKSLVGNEAVPRQIYADLMRRHADAVERVGGS